MAKIKNPISVINKQGAPKRTLWFWETKNSLNSALSNQTLTVDSLNLTNTQHMVGATDNYGNMFRSANITVIEPTATITLKSAEATNNDGLFQFATVNGLQNLVLNLQGTNAGDQTLGNANFNGINSITVNLLDDKAADIYGISLYLNSNSSQINKLTINCDYPIGASGGLNSANIKELELNCDCSESTTSIFDYDYAYYLNGPETITGTPIDFTSNTHQITIFKNLESVRFAENTVSQNIDMRQNSIIDDSSLISIANSLINTGTSQTLNMDGESRPVRIKGTISLDPTETYYIFTPDSTGPDTLADFITNTKGWTIT